MSDFPKGGDIEATRAWLDKEGFQGLFVGWKADALLGADKEDILIEAGGKGRMLWGLLNTARITTGTLYRLKIIPSSLYSGIFFFFS
jgi:hypothetical protein